MSDLDDKIDDIRKTIRTADDLDAVVFRLFGEDSNVSVGKTRNVSISTGCTADEDYTIRVASTGALLDGEEE